MRVLHIAHYDRYPHEATTFFDKPLNGIEKWLADIIANTKIEHYVLFFNHYEDTIFIEKILPDGRATVYTSYSGIAFGKSEIEQVFKDILFWLPLDLIHIHYLQEYVKDLPEILYNFNFKNIIATMHDESYLGKNYGIDKNYHYDSRVASFFTFLKKVVFINDITRKRFEKYYYDELLNKSIIISNGVDMLTMEYKNISKHDTPFKVLFLGTMHEVKGGKIVADISENGIDGVDFYLLGSIETSPKKLIDCGRYDKTNLIEKIAKINPDIVAIPSIAEETFSYTAAEATQLGYPVLSFSVGVLQNIEVEKRGFVVIEKNSEAFKEKIMEIKEMKASEPERWSEILTDVKKVKVFSVEDMVYSYSTVYQQVVGNKIDNNEINWEHIMELNLREKKRKELLYLHKHNDYETEKQWKKNVPMWLHLLYGKYIKIKKRKINNDK